MGIKFGANAISADAIRCVDPSIIPPTPGEPDEFILEFEASR